MTTGHPRGPAGVGGALEDEHLRTRSRGIDRGAPAADAEADDENVDFIGVVVDRRRVDDVGKRGAFGFSDAHGASP